MAGEPPPGYSILPPHLLKVLAGRQRHAMAHQNGLVAPHMVHILFLANKLDCVAEDVISCPTAYMLVTEFCSAYLLYGGERRFRPHNRFLPPHFTLRWT